MRGWLAVASSPPAPVTLLPQRLPGARAMGWWCGWVGKSWELVAPWAGQEHGGDSSPCQALLLLPGTATLLWSSLHKHPAWIRPQVTLMLPWEQEELIPAPHHHPWENPRFKARAR